MNDDENNAGPRAWIDPALEARVVAGVLGECSAFESAELERLLAENPELAIFKRRIEATHSLVGAAVRQETPKIQLSPDRRKKLLERLGAPAPQRKKLLAISRPTWFSPGLLIPLAASLVIGALTVSFFGTMVVYQSSQEPPEFAGEAGGFVVADSSAPVDVSVSAKPARQPLPVAAMALPPQPVISPTSTSLALAANSSIGPAFAMAPARQEVPQSDVASAGLAKMAEESDRMLVAKGDAASDIVEREVSRRLQRSRELLPSGAEEVRDEISARPSEPAADAVVLKSEYPQREELGANVTERKEKASSLLQEAQDFKNSGRYDLASKRYSQVQELDKDNAEAREGMEQINESREKYAKQANNQGRGDGVLLASRGWERPVRSFDRRAPEPAGSRQGDDTKKPQSKDAPLGAKKRSSSQPEISTVKQPFSTFSLHVSDVSFLLAKEALAKGTRPAAEQIRSEEFYNAFDFNDPAPSPGEAVACRIEQCAHPFLQQRNLVRMAVKVAATGRASGQPLRLTVLLDTSGSMEREDRAASVHQALQTLASLLGPSDRITLIGFARTPRLLADQVTGDQSGKLVEIAGRTPSEGGTNLEQALALATEQARKNFLPNGQNRIVLLTDGAANLGNADPARLSKLVGKARQQGISFDACGVGAGGLNDEMLEALTRQGDGRYYFLNRPEDADAGFARQLAGTLRPAAENVKVQVVWNPARVRQYRLLGFEKHLLKKEDFRNDKVQAAELAAEEAGVAIYQVEPLPEGDGDLGEVFVRFRDPATGQMVERSWVIPYDAKAPAFDQATASMQLAATAALLAENLRGYSHGDLEDLAPTVARLRGEFPHQARVAELIRMFEQTKALTPAAK